MDVDLSKLWKRVEDRGARRGAAHGVAKSQDTPERLDNNNRLNTALHIVRQGFAAHPSHT